MHPSAALLVIDMQQDFLPGGRLAVPGGDMIVPIVNRLARKFEHVILTQDWHPHAHISFATTHGKRPFLDTVEASYGRQSLWPEHTLQGSSGADFADGLDLPNAEMIVRKGFRVSVDSYSAFLENDHITPTGLAGYLRERQLSHLYLCGLAWDYCVGHSALDARELGFQVSVITDAVRGIDDEAVQAMTEHWLASGVHLISSDEVERSG